MGTKPVKEGGGKEGKRGEQGGRQGKGEKGERGKREERGGKGECCPMGLPQWTSLIATMKRGRDCCLSKGPLMTELQHIPLPCMALYCNGEMCSNPLGATSQKVESFLRLDLWFFLSLALSSSLRANMAAAPPSSLSLSRDL
jgi:hypothetical protein